MSGLGARLRGVLGLSAISGVVGAVIGGIATGVMMLIGVGGIVPMAILSGAMAWGGFGALAGGGFGVLLTALASGHPLEELPLWKAGLLGALPGAVAPVGLMLGVGAAIPTWSVLLPLVGICSGLGGILGIGLIATARNAPDRDLGSGGGRRALGSGREL
jgi:hypothetical protein